MLNTASAGIPEHRKGKNLTYTLREAVFGAFSVFFMQSAAFLEHQEQMQSDEGHNNATSLFGMKSIPSDNQIRNLLDPLEAGHLFQCLRTFPVFWKKTGSCKHSGPIETIC